MLTGVDDQVPNNTPVANGEHVLVQFDEERYGLYRYIGTVPTGNLSAQDYSNSNLWEEIQTGIDTAAGETVHGTDDKTPITITTSTRVEFGNIVYKFVGPSSITEALQNIDFTTDPAWMVDIEDVFSQDAAQISLLALLPALLS